MELTKKSKKDLYGRYNGHGVVFVKTGDREMQMIEFYLDRNGRFRTFMNGMELEHRLYDLQRKIEDEG